MNDISRLDDKGSFLRRHSLALKGLVLVALQFAYTWWTILYPFFSNGLPTGWDSGAYLAWENSLKIGGFNYVQNPNFYQYSGLNVIPGLLLTGTVSVSSLLIGYVLFQIIILGLFFASLLFLSWEIRRSFSYTFLVMALLVTSYAFIRMTRDLYGNLLTVSFLQFALGLVIVLRRGPDRRTSLGLAVATGLMFFTDVEVGGFGVVVILSAILLNAFGTRQVAVTKRLLMPVVASVLVSLGLWSGLAIGYLSVSTLLVSAFGSADWQTILLSLGGYALIPIWGVTLFLIFNQMRKRPDKMDSSILGGWSVAFVLTCGILLLFRPSLVFRVALLLPLTFLLAEAIRFSWSFSSTAWKSKGLIKPLGLIILLSIGVLVTVASATTFVSQTYSYQTAPFISRDQYQTLTKASALLKSNGMTVSNTLFLIYPQQRLSVPQGVSAWTNLYDNWISATFGPHTSFYGTLGNLTLHIPMNILSSDEGATYQSYRNMFASSSMKPSVDVVMISFLYNGNEIKYANFSNPLPGVYTYNWNFSARESPAWVPSYYALNQTGGYFKPETWSLTGTVLESYQSKASTTSNNFEANFSAYIPSTGTYSVDLRMYDYSSSNSPIIVGVNGRDLFGLSYYGSQTPTIFTAILGNLTKGYCILTLHTVIGDPHNLDLDSIKIEPASTAAKVSAQSFPATWSIIDGSGTVNSSPYPHNSTSVLGSPDASGLIGAGTSFSTAFDLSGSRFITFQFNSSVSGRLSVWLNDSSGNTVRYDSRYDSPDTLQEITIPIVPYGYGYSTPALPTLSDIRFLEIGISTSQQAPVAFEFRNLVSVSNPIPIQYL